MITAKGCVDMAWLGGTQLVRRRVLVLAIALVVGVGVGALAYVISRLGGIAPYLVIGGVAAMLGAGVWGWFTRSAAVTEVEVAVPQFSRVTFAVTKDHKIMARKLVVQLVSRVSVRPLDDDAGRIDEALASLHALFQYVRDLLLEDAGTRATPGRPKVDVLAINMLGQYLAPFLSRWHPRYGDWRQEHPAARESEWADNHKFRTELRLLQSALRQEAVAFATMSEYEGYLDIIGLTER